MASAPVEYDAQGKPIPASNSPAPEYDASGKPLPGQTGGGHDPALDNAPQGNPGFFGPIQDAYDSVIARPPQADLDKVGPIGRGFANFGRGVMELGQPIMHPIKTVQAALPHSVSELAQDVIVPGSRMIGNMVMGGVQDAKEHGIPEALEHGAGQIAGGYLGGKLAEAPLKAGAPMERVGYGAINDALGARGPKPFQYGHNPARGALEEGVVPAISKQESSTRVQPAMDRVGGQIGSAIGSSPNSILLKDIAASVNSPLRAASAVAEGPGVGGATSEQIGKVGESMTRRAPGASRPIYGAGAGTPYAPHEVVSAMSKPIRALPAPQEELPLHSSPDVAGTPSRPITIHQPDRPGMAALPAPAHDFPLTENPFHGRIPPNEGVESAEINGSRVAEPFTTPEGNPNYGYSDQFPSAEGKWTGGVLRRVPDGGTASGMGKGEYIGQVSGERGGLGEPQGLLRRTPNYGPSNEPSQFSDMRHPTATPNDVWRTIQNLDEKTRYNKLTPEVEGMNELQQGIRHGLRGNLEEAVPQIKGPSQTYGDLAGARDAIERTIHSGQSLSKIMDLIKYPSETYGGAGLVKGGRLLQSIDPRFLRTIGRAPAVAAPLLKQGGQ